MSKGRIVAFVPDLFFSVRVADVIRRLGYQPQIVERPDHFTAALDLQTGSLPLALVIVDMNAPPQHWSQTVRDLKDDPERNYIPVLAFGSHLDVERQRLAREAGCDRIVANSKFHEALSTLINTMARDQE
ncbi:MAG: hypothetical protein KatS3mg057_2376 [Herpetosiphonaceae bacterium]|nr:MAG: hypothetical protein KatS3mg057_2376 [Herpetosiphonaceae bacterium]